MNCAFCEQSFWYICGNCIDVYNETPQGRDTLRLAIYTFLKDALVKINSIVTMIHRINTTNLSNLDCFKYQKFLKSVEGLWVVLEPIAGNKYTSITIPFTIWNMDLLSITFELTKLRKFLLICLQRHPHLLVTSTDIANHVMNYCSIVTQNCKPIVHSPFLPRYNIFKDAAKLGFTTITPSFTEEPKQFHWQEIIGPLSIPFHTL